jgi:integrase
VLLLKAAVWKAGMGGDAAKPDTGIDIVTVQKLMGHANPATTAAYDRRPERTKRKAVDALDVLCLES